MSEAYVTPTAEEFIAGRKKALVGRAFRMKDIGREGVLIWKCDAVTLFQESNHPLKVAIIMRLTLDRIEGKRHHGDHGAKVGDAEYRIGYYIVARNGKRWWGQYALMLPAGDLQLFLDKAREEKTLLDHTPAADTSPT